MGAVRTLATGFVPVGELTKSITGVLGSVRRALLTRASPAHITRPEHELQVQVLPVNPFGLPVLTVESPYVEVLVGDGVQKLQFEPTAGAQRPVGASGFVGAGVTVFEYPVAKNWKVAGPNVVR
jgi:hypothetical protein